MPRYFHIVKEAYPLKSIATTWMNNNNLSCSSPMRQSTFFHSRVGLYLFTSKSKECFPVKLSSEFSGGLKNVLD